MNYRYSGETGEEFHSAFSRKCESSRRNTMKEDKYIILMDINDRLPPSLVNQLPKLLPDGVDLRHTISHSIFKDNIRMDGPTKGLQVIPYTDIEEEPDELAAGTFCSIHKATWKGVDVVTKRIKESCFKDVKQSDKNKIVMKFWREANILWKVRNWNVVPLYGVVSPVESLTNLKMVCEYVPDRCLRTIFSEKKWNLSKRQKIKIATDAACGLDFLHSNNIVNLDLKSTNLLVNRFNPSCKIGDLGLFNTKIKMVDDIKGTLPWIAPELLDGIVSDKTDIYSFGMVLWELWTGKEPYWDLTDQQVIERFLHKTLEPSMASNFDRDCKDWESLIKECLASDPKARPSSKEVARRLGVMGADIWRTKPPANS